MESERNPSGPSRVLPQATPAGVTRGPSRPVPTQPDPSAGTLDRGVAGAREAQNETGPLRKIWDALHHHGCKPHGDAYRFRAACPVHQGNNTDALQVYEGINGQAVFGCYAQGCEKRSILDAIGLTWKDAFPAGHKSGSNARPARPAKPRPLTRGAAFLDTLTLAGYRWQAAVMLAECPYCTAERCVVRVWDAPEADNDRFVISVDCSDGCDAESVRRAVETRAAIAEKGLVL